MSARIRGAAAFALIALLPAVLLLAFTASLAPIAAWILAWVLLEASRPLPAPPAPDLCETGRRIAACFDALDADMRALQARMRTDFPSAFPTYDRRQGEAGAV